MEHLHFFCPVISDSLLGHCFLDVMILNVSSIPLTQKAIKRCVAKQASNDF